MAGDWIKIEITTPDKPEIFQLADALGIDPDAVVGKLFRVWGWADQQTTNGNAPSVTKTLLDRLTCVPGFAKALIEVGWLVQHEYGLTFTNFERHNGQTAKTRALSLKRTRKHRNASVTMSALPRDRERDIDTNKQNSSSKTPKARQKRKLTTDYSTEFCRWYETFPRLAGKEDAAKAFEPAIERIMNSRKIDRSGAIQWLMERTDAYTKSVEDTEAKYIKTPGPWLNGNRFNDSLSPKASCPNESDQIPKANGRASS